MSSSNIYILGISAFNSDAAAALIKDGEIIAAVQEERFTRIKYDASFPKNSISYCLRKAGITQNELSAAMFCGNSFSENEIRGKLDFNGEIIFVEHHKSHAASAFYPSPFSRSAIITIDGMADDIVTSFGYGREGSIDYYSEVRAPHSIGLLYSVFTSYCGFQANSDEYKLMGLASYGKPLYVDMILENLIDIRENGSFILRLEYFDYSSEHVVTTGKFNKLFGGLPRKSGSAMEGRHMDLARSIQSVTEIVMLKMARYAYERTKCDNLCLAGEVALNCVANGRLLREGPFKNIWIQPCASDAGCALGAAFMGWRDYMGKPPAVKMNNDLQKASFLGPSFSDEEIERYLKDNNVKYERLGSCELAKRVSAFLSEQKIIGWFQGRMEFGPRGLGSRSILADPRSANMRSMINSKIKFRESFRPFAPSILSEAAGEYFDLKCESPYMLFVSQVKKRGFPSITHVDNSARVQTVRREDNPLFYDIIAQFRKDYGCPMVINTSFNIMGEPIVCTPEDAYKCFMKTAMDYLIMGPFLCRHD